MRSLSSSRPVRPIVSGEGSTRLWFQMLPSDPQLGLRLDMAGVKGNYTEQVSKPLSCIDRGWILTGCQAGHDSGTFTVLSDPK